MEGPDFLPVHEESRIRPHRRPVRAVGPQRHRLRPDRVSVPAPDAGGRFRARGCHLLHAAAATPAGGLTQECDLHGLSRGRPHHPHRSAAALTLGRPAAPAGDRRREQPMHSTASPSGPASATTASSPTVTLSSRRRPRSSTPCSRRGDLPQRSGHCRDCAPAPGEGLHHRSRGPRPHLAVLDRAHPPLMRVLRPRSWHPARGRTTRTWMSTSARFEAPTRLPWTATARRHDQEGRPWSPTGSETRGHRPAARLAGPDRRPASVRC